MYTWVRWGEARPGYHSQGQRSAIAANQKLQIKFRVEVQVLGVKTQGGFRGCPSMLEVKIKGQRSMSGAVGLRVRSWVDMED